MIYPANSEKLEKGTVDKPTVIFYLLFVYLGRLNI